MRATHLGRSIAISIAIGTATPAIAENAANAVLDNPFSLTPPPPSVVISTPAPAWGGATGIEARTRDRNVERGAPVTPPDRIVP